MLLTLLYKKKKSKRMSGSSNTTRPTYSLLCIGRQSLIYLDFDDITLFSLNHNN